jgi:hypothetical protein
MKRIIGGLFVLLIAVALLVPAPVAASLAEDCTFDGPVKWEDNPDSWFLYLQNWGRTPVNSMSRLAGLAVTSISQEKCTSAICGSEATCPECGGGGFCWGSSLCFANKGWAGCDISPAPNLNNDHPNHRVGDWGISGCPHPECTAESWCLPQNLCSTQ